MANVAAPSNLALAQHTMEGIGVTKDESEAIRFVREICCSPIGHRLNFLVDNIIQNFLGAIKSFEIDSFWTDQEYENFDH